MTGDDEVARARDRRQARTAATVPPTDDYRAARARLVEAVEANRYDEARRRIRRTGRSVPAITQNRPVVNVDTGGRL